MMTKLDHNRNTTMTMGRVWRRRRDGYGDDEMGMVEYGLPIGLQQQLAVGRNLGSDKQLM